MDTDLFKKFLYLALVLLVLFYFIYKCDICKNIEKFSENEQLNNLNTMLNRELAEQNRLKLERIILSEEEELMKRSLLENGLTNLNKNLNIKKPEVKKEKSNICEEEIITRCRNPDRNLDPKEELINEVNNATKSLDNIKKKLIDKIRDSNILEEEAKKIYANAVNYRDSVDNENRAKFMNEVKSTFGDLTKPLNDILQQRDVDEAVMDFRNKIRNKNKNVLIDQKINLNDDDCNECEDECEEYDDDYWRNYMNYYGQYYQQYMQNMVKK